MNDVPVVVIPMSAHRPMREAIAPNLSMFNTAADVTGFIVVALGDDAYELRTDLPPDLARQWLLALAAEMDGDQ